MSCTNHQNDLVTTISEDVLEKSSIEKLFHVEKTKLMFLEEDSDVVVGQINKMISCNDDLFVLSTNGSSLSNLYRYSIDGQFINKIGTFGGASNEYLFISTFFVQDDKVYIVDTRRNKLLVYSFDGTFIQAIKATDDEFLDALDATAIDHENVLVFHGIHTEPGTLFSIFNIPKKKVVNKIATDISAPFWRHYSSTRWAQNSSGTFFFLPFDKGIYTMNDKFTKEKTMQVDYLGKIPNFSSTQYDEIEQLIYDSDVSLFFSIYANEQILLISFLSGSIIWDISKQHANFIPNSSDCTNNVFPFEGTYIKCATKDGFIAFIDEDSFKTILSEHKPSDLFNNSESEIENRLYDGSPILVRYYLK